MQDDETTYEDEPLDLAELGDASDEPVGKAGAGKTAATAAMSTLLAVSLAGALSEPPNTDQMILPEPTPIVRIYQEDEPEEPVPEPEEEVDERAERWRRLFKLLKYLAIVALFAAMLILGALKGCASCSAGLLVPDDDQQQEQVQPA